MSSLSITVWEGEGEGEDGRTSVGLILSGKTFHKNKRAIATTRQVKSQLLNTWTSDWEQEMLWSGNNISIVPLGARGRTSTMVVQLTGKAPERQHQKIQNTIQVPFQGEPSQVYCMGIEKVLLCNFFLLLRILHAALYLVIRHPVYRYGVQSASSVPT